MPRGFVKWFSDLKGYGFIASDDFTEDLYVNFSEICAVGYRTLKKGDEVVFEVEESPGGIKAKKVTKIQ
jgi:CspA family cold shock protein